MLNVESWHRKSDLTHILVYLFLFSASSYMFFNTWKFACLRLYNAIAFLLYALVLNLWSF